MCCYLWLDGVSNEVFDALVYFTEWMWYNLVCLCIHLISEMQFLIPKTLWGKHIFMIHINCCSSTPALLQFLSEWWGHGWLCVVVSLDLPTFSPPLPLDPGNWWLPEKSNAGRLSFGKRQGYKGREVLRYEKCRRFEMDDYCWQRRNSRPASEDNIAECSVCACRRCAFMHAFMSVPAWGARLCRATIIVCTAKTKYTYWWLYVYVLDAQRRNREVKTSEQPVTTAVQCMNFSKASIIMFGEVVHATIHCCCLCVIMWCWSKTTFVLLFD